MTKDLVKPALDMLNGALESTDDEEARHHIREAQQLLQGLGDETDPAPIPERN